MVFVAQEYQTTVVSFTKPVYCFCEGIYQSQELSSVDRQVNECHIGLRLPCIEQRIGFYKEHYAQSFCSKTTIIMSLHVTSKWRVVEYVHANATKAIENDGYV